MPKWTGWGRRRSTFFEKDMLQNSPGWKAVLEEMVKMLWMCLLRCGEDCPGRSTL